MHERKQNGKTYQPSNKATMMFDGCSLWWIWLLGRGKRRCQICWAVVTAAT